MAQKVRLAYDKHCRARLCEPGCDPRIHRASATRRILPKTYRRGAKVSRGASRRRGRGEMKALTISPAERARAYLERMPGAVEGQGGDLHTYRAACILVNDFGLSEAEAWP